MTYQHALFSSSITLSAWISILFTNWFILAVMIYLLFDKSCHFWDNVGLHSLLQNKSLKDDTKPQDIQSSLFRPVYRLNVHYPLHKISLRFMQIQFFICKYVNCIRKLNTCTSTVTLEAHISIKNLLMESNEENHTHNLQRLNYPVLSGNGNETCFYNSINTIWYFINTEVDNYRLCSLQPNKNAAVVA